MNEKLEQQLTQDLLVSGIFSTSTAEIPSEAWEHEPSHEQSIAASAISGAYGPNFNTSEFVSRALNGEVTDTEYAALEATRTRVRKAAYDNLDLDRF